MTHVNKKRYFCRNKKLTVEMQRNCNYMNHLRLLLAFFTMAVMLSARAQSQERQLFDGGMMVHTGYLQGHISAMDYNAKGMTFGLGGVLRFHLGNHLRLGGEGYVSTLRQMKNGSYFRTSWGGLLADAYWKFGRWQPYIGLTLGGGRTSSLLMFDGSSEDWAPETDVVVHNEAFFCINTNIGVEFALTPAVHLTFKTDWLVPLPTREMPSGPRFYLGVVFAH